MGYNLTMYAAGKYLTTRIRSGKVSMRSCNGTSPTHIPLANDSGGNLLQRKVLAQMTQTFA